jgi:hypothetical protein
MGVGIDDKLGGIDPDCDGRKEGYGLGKVDKLG